jgi:hypothetical protein
MAITYLVSIRKSFGPTSGKDTWVNNYHVRCNNVTLRDELEDAVNSLVAFEKGFHQREVRFISATCTAQDGPNYKTPQGTSVIALDGTGSRQRADVNAETGVFFQSIALYVKFPTDDGNAGSKVYRGVLTEENTVWGAGYAVIQEFLYTYFNESKAGLFSQLKAWAIVVEQTSKGNRVGFSDASDALIQGVKSWKSDRRRAKKTAVNPESKSIMKQIGAASEILSNVASAVAIAGAKGNEIVLTAAAIKALNSARNTSLALLPANGD